MKTLSILLFTICSFASFGQSQQDSTKAVDLRIPKQETTVSKSAGQIAGGCVLMLGGTLLMLNSGDDKAPFIFGGACAIVGFGITINSLNNLSLKGR